MLTRLAIGIAWLLHMLPLTLLNPLGQACGLLFFRLGRSRRTVARTNLRLCFPQWSEAERERVLRAHFRAFGRAVLEAGIVWWARPARLRKVVRIEGIEHVQALGDRPRILLAPHFVGLEQAGLRVALEWGGVAVYVQQKNKIFDAFLLSRRQRFTGVTMVSRPEGVKPLVRALRAGRLVQLSPDMDLGPRDSLFVPFLGVQAATVTALPRLCQLGAAVVVPVIITQLPGAGGYCMRLFPPWENYPSGDVEADTRRMNAFIEARILEQPEQYLWTHKRFKTRPPGEPRYYP